MDAPEKRTDDDSRFEAPAARRPWPAASGRVLLADPDRDTRRAYRRALQPLHCRFDEAQDGREALVKALAYRPILLVAELRLGFIDGAALCEILRRDRTTAQTAIVIATSSSDTEMRRARQLGADVVLVKPLGAGLLLQHARRLLARAPRRAHGSAAHSHAR